MNDLKTNEVEVKVSENEEVVMVNRKTIDKMRNAGIIAVAFLAVVVFAFWFNERPSGNEGGISAHNNSSTSSEAESVDLDEMSTEELIAFGQELLDDLRLIEDTIQTDLHNRFVIRDEPLFVSVDCYYMESWFQIDFVLTDSLVKDIIIGALSKNCPIAIEGWLYLIEFSVSIASSYEDILGTTVYVDYFTTDGESVLSLGSRVIIQDILHDLW